MVYIYDIDTGYVTQLAQNNCLESARHAIVWKPFQDKCLKIVKTSCLENGSKTQIVWSHFFRQYSYLRSYFTRHYLHLDSRFSILINSCQRCWGFSLLNSNDFHENYAGSGIRTKFVRMLSKICPDGLYGIAIEFITRCWGIIGSTVQIPPCSNFHEKHMSLGNKGKILRLLENLIWLKLVKQKIQSSWGNWCLVSGVAVGWDESRNSSVPVISNLNMGICCRSIF